MSKNNNRKRFDLTGVDPTVEISKHLTKNGKLTGSKKEKKALRSICPHHSLNRKGKVKARIHDEGNKNCQCPICKERFRSGFYSDQEFDAAYAKFKPIASQAKFIATATNAGKGTIEEISSLNLHIDTFGKTYRNLRSVAEKQDKVKNKKKKQRERENIGGWRLNN